MTGWLVALLIYISMQCNFNSMGVFRFRRYYVNYLFSHIESAMLHNLLFGGIAGLDIISCFPAGHNFIGFFWKSK